MTFTLSENIGKGLDYLTENQLGSRHFVKATVVSEPIGKDKLLNRTQTGLFNGLLSDNDASSCKEVYEWIGVSSVIRSSEPCCWVLSYEDYYSSEQYDSRNIRCGAEAGFNYKTADFSVTYNGTVYDECRMVLVINQPEAGTDTEIYETAIKVFYCVPKGYDGCVLGFHNSSALTRQQIEKGMTDPAACLGLISRAEGDLYIRIK